MHEEIIIAGFGGQGVLFAGQVLAHAALMEERNVTWIPSYGPEMRGGTAHCTVIVSDEEIGSPLVRHPSAALVLNPPSMEKYAALVKPGGVLVLDSTLIAQRARRDDIRELQVPARALATEIGMPQAANMVLLGALAQSTGVVQLETLEKLLAERFGEGSEKFEANRRALHAGAERVGSEKNQAR